MNKTQDIEYTLKDESHYSIKLKGYMNLFRNTYNKRPKYTIEQMTSSMVKPEDGLTERRFMEQVNEWEKTEDGRKIRELHYTNGLISIVNTEAMLTDIINELGEIYLEYATEDEVKIWVSTDVHPEEAIKSVYRAAENNREGAFEMMYVQYILVSEAISIKTLKETYSTKD